MKKALKQGSLLLLVFAAFFMPGKAFAASCSNDYSSAPSYTLSFSGTNPIAAGLPDWTGGFPQYGAICINGTYGGGGDFNNFNSGFFGLYPSSGDSGEFLILDRDPALDLSGAVVLAQASFSCSSSTYCSSFLGFFPTHFLWPYIPPNPTVTTTSPSVFSFQYQISCSDWLLYDKVGVQMVDQTDASVPVILRSGSPGACGATLNTFTDTVSYPLNHFFSWRPVLYSSAASATPIYGNLSYFSSLGYIPSAFGGLISLSSTTIANPSTTGLSVTDFLSFLNVPYLLETKIPFGYFFQAKTALETALNSSTSVAIPSGGITYNLGYGSTTVVMFSTSTLAYFLNATEIAFLRSIMVIVLIAEFIYAMYHRVRNLHLT